MVRALLLLPLFSLFAGSAFAGDMLALGSGEALPGARIEIPILLKDVSGTRLGSDAVPIQAIALRVVAEPPAAVRAITFRRSGATARLQPQFEHAVEGEGSGGYLVSFAASRGRIVLRLDPDDAGDEIGRAVVHLSDDAVPGTTFRLMIDPLTATLSDEGGTVTEQTADDSLRLHHGEITVR